MSEPGVNSRNSPPSVDVFIAAIATRQHGLIALVHLLALGLTRSAVRKRERAGRLHRVHRGVYAVGHPRLSQEGKWMAAVLAAGQGAMLSHLSAAAHWNVWRRRVQGTDVISLRRRRAEPGIRADWTRHLDPRDITVHRGIRSPPCPAHWSTSPTC